MLMRVRNCCSHSRSSMRQDRTGGQQRRAPRRRILHGRSRLRPALRAPACSRCCRTTHSMCSASLFAARLPRRRVVRGTSCPAMSCSSRTCCWCSPRMPTGACHAVAHMRVRWQSPHPLPWIPVASVRPLLSWLPSRLPVRAPSAHRLPESSLVRTRAPMPAHGSGLMRIVEPGGRQTCAPARWRRSAAG